MVFRARMFSSAVHSDIDLLVGFIEEWVTNGASVTIDGSVIVFEPQFPVTNNALNDLMCTQTSVVISSPSSTPVPPVANSPLVIPVIGVLVAIVVLVLLCILIVIVLLCFSKRRRRQKCKLSSIRLVR